MQVGLDMAPTPAPINTWESNCKNYNTTVAAWKKVQSEDWSAFNAVLATNSLPPVPAAPSKLTAAACRVVPPPRARAPAKR